MTHVRKTDQVFDLDRIESEIASLEATFPFKFNALCLTHPLGDFSEIEKLHVGCGSLYVAEEKKWRYLEPDFKVFNERLKGTYLHDVYSRMQELTGGFIGRFRIMRLNSKACYYMHDDADSPRYHLAIQTNPDAFFIFETPQGGHEVARIPRDGCIYEFDARDRHTAINAGHESRTHLVFSNTRLWIPKEEQVYLEPRP